MAIIVDKVQKRKDIALTCKDIFVHHGIKDLTISQIAKTAGIGKGTIYEYFQNKEDIIFEIVNILIKERNIIVEERMSKIDLVKDKIKYFSRFFYCEEDFELRKLYIELISISLSSPEEKMIAFQTECFNYYYRWFEQIIQDAIDKDEIIQESKLLTKGFFYTTKGMFIASLVTHSIENLQEEIERHIDAIFMLIEVKK